jgi:tetratricopeptide (TPR) repeat protein
MLRLPFYFHQRFRLFCFCIVVMVGQACFSGESLPADIHQWALTTIENIYNEEFRAAEDEVRKIIKNYPNHPAGFFFMAAIMDSWMSTYMSDSRENEFYRFCELTIEKGDKYLKKEPDDQWAQFFIGGAEGYKGTYEARFDRWITAFRCGWKGVSILSQLKERNSGLVDILYGIGSYEYWRSALTKNLRWMPGVDDKRAVGIEKIKKAMDSGTYTRAAAAIGLVDIYINEKYFNPAIAIADKALLKFPRSRMFIFGKAKALLGAGNYDEAESLFRKVLLTAEKNPAGEHAIIAYCYFWLAKTFLQSARYAECISACDNMKKYQFNDDTKKFLSKYFDEIETIKKQAIRGHSDRNSEKQMSKR